MNKRITTIAIISIAVLAGGAMFLSRDSTKDTKGAATASLNNQVSKQDDTISQKGIHWHPELSIVIKGEKQSIPANIGIGMQYAGYPQYDSMMMMTDMHTHDPLGKLHWEVMEGPVKKDDIQLGQFFSVWGKKFDSFCIFEFCNGLEGTVKMLVNGQPNEEFQNYLIKDEDKIEIRYE